MQKRMIAGTFVSLDGNPETDELGTTIASPQTISRKLSISTSNQGHMHGHSRPFVNHSDRTQDSDVT